MKNGLIIDELGHKLWFQNGILHRLEGPAIESVDGSKFWYEDGMLHRSDGPAVEFITGNKLWYYKGTQIHCCSQQEFEKLIKLKAFW